jgi:hypothetical protein
VKRGRNARRITLEEMAVVATTPDAADRSAYL